MLSINNILFIEFQKCPRSFYYESQLKEHSTIHTGEKPHTCPYCDQKFRLLKVCKEHIRIHTGEKPFKCDYCNECFRISLELRKHTNSMHKMEMDAITQEVLQSVTEYNVVETIYPSDIEYIN